MSRRRRRRRRGPRRLVPASELVSDLLDSKGAKRELREHRIATHWESIVGHRVSARTLPDGLSDGVLWVRVSSSAWLHELSFLKAEIVKQINTALGDPPIVSEVRFHLGGRKADAGDSLAPTLAIRRPPLAKRKLPEPAKGERLERIVSETDTVEDDELRMAIREARRKLNL